MSQILVPHVDGRKTLLFQDLYFSKRRASVKSTVKEATCTICDKGLEEGTSVTAKQVGQKMRFFCQYHLPKDD
ncbi:hypothetical protein DYY67_0015 [Candidatus Nitrosotalea sp. TS]|uniref:hypothetical protein n=1 Tax=Candidatus Nitrosotalea sp. TS TaxID=2341020 RepID=UPI001407CB63|nr:hypothetical protein [Candidatus Nitrosotalea sp. TS]NHI02894.1 hypothetical protein [Candidatus Nitrosotalea sp. TS]